MLASPLVSSVQTPDEIVTEIAIQNSVGPLYLHAIWLIEGSRKIYCKDGTVKERGCFQVRPETWDFMKCEGFPRFLIPSAKCGIKWIKRGQRLCRDGDKRKEAYIQGIYYNAGVRCKRRHRNHPSGYGKRVAIAMNNMEVE